MSQELTKSSHFRSVQEMLNEQPGESLYDTADKCFDRLWRISNHEKYHGLDSVSFLLEPDIFHLLCEFLARGGTMREIILKLGINVGEFFVRLHRIPRAYSMWQSALIRREETIREVALSTHMAVIDADIRQLFGKNGDSLPPHKWPYAVARAVKKIEYDKLGGIKSIELYDKQKSADSLRKGLQKQDLKSGENAWFKTLQKFDKRNAKKRLDSEKKVVLEHKE